MVGKLNTHFVVGVAFLLVLVTIDMYGVGCCALQRVADRHVNSRSHGEYNSQKVNSQAKRGGFK